ncbi:hypothetical protein AYO44_04210 [Planctomycetaceae bacterium SCGC AG-212-F19]|nr:hypothetical protein AYO44_04210 [Planctomycetaceae bacterium SCGC AG-212-F19]
MLLDRVEIIHGANQDYYAVAGRTVGYVRQVLGDVFSIPPDSESLIDGSTVQDDQLLRAGDCLEFIKASGRKSVGHRVWTDKGLCKFFKLTPEDPDDWQARGCKPLRAKDGSRRWTEDAIDEFNGLQKACGWFPVIDGKTISFLSPRQLQLFKIAWRHPGTSLEDAIDEVYGHDADDKDNAIKQLAKLVNAKLVKHGVNRVVSLAGSKVTLE